MKKLFALFASLLMLTPVVAMAQGPGQYLPRAEMKAELRANASTTKPLTPGSLPKLGATMRDIASTTRAFGSSSVEMVKARVEAIKQIIEQKREEMKQRAENAREKARERFGEHVETLVGNVSARLASTSAHLSAIADRIDTRIDTLEDEGHDMSNSIALLAEDRADLSAANDKILAVNAALETAMGTTTPKGSIPAVRAAVKAAQDALKLAKDDLMETIRSVKAEGAATTTSST